MSSDRHEQMVMFFEKLKDGGSTVCLLITNVPREGLRGCEVEKGRVIKGRTAWIG